MRAYTEVRLGMDHDDAEGGGEAGSKQGREGKGSLLGLVSFSFGFYSKYVMRVLPRVFIN